MYRAHNGQLGREGIQKRFLMGIRNLSVALVLSVSMLCAQGEIDYERAHQVLMLREAERARRRMEAEREWQRLGREEPSLKWEELSKEEKAQKEFEKALEAVRKKKYERALRQLKKATEIDPQHTGAFYEMGRIRLQQNRKEEARKAFEQAIVANPKRLHPYHNQPQQLLETSNEILPRISFMNYRRQPSE